jgi:hypothetical protein
MLTPVERVLVLSNIDLLKPVGPRNLVGLARASREVEIWKGQILYQEEDLADALYVVVEGRVGLSVGDRELSALGPGEAFGTWALVDDSARGQKATCLEDGLVLALDREEFYEVASGEISILQELLRALAKRLRALVTDRPEEARVEGEGMEAPEAPETPAVQPKVDEAGPTTGSELEAAALGKEPKAETKKPRKRK